MKLQGGIIFHNKFFVILFLVVAGFFVGQKCLASPSIGINEIAWMGTKESSMDEWLELFNSGGDDIDITGWQIVSADGTPNIVLSGIIYGHGYFLLERTDDETLPNIEADQIYVGALGNQGEDLELRNNNGEVVDSVNQGSGWAGGDNETKQTLIRLNEHDWGTSNEIGGTPGLVNIIEQPDAICGNGVLETGEECDDGNVLSSDGCGPDCLAEENMDSGLSGNDPLPSAEQDDGGGDGNDYGSDENYNIGRGDIVINEFCPDPSDGEVEWIELYSNLGREINLDGWYIMDGSLSKTQLSGVLGSGEKNYYIIEKPKGNLNNSGDIIRLYYQTQVIDQVAYGNWDDGNADNNAPAASDPYSVARIMDGQNTFQNDIDFIITTSPTKGSSNIIDEINENKIFDYNEDVIISELFPNPEGADSEGEFIELKNKGSVSVSLDGWRIKDDSDKVFDISGIVIYGGEYLVLERSRTSIALNNSNDSVSLFQPEKDRPLQTVRYEKSIEGQSYSWDEAKKKWSWSEVVTPGKENIIKAINQAPQVDFCFPEKNFVGAPIIFDSSDTVDDSEELSYFWDFGDAATNTLPSPEHTYFKAGEFRVKLSVSDGEAEKSVEKTVTVYSDKILEAGKEDLAEEKTEDKEPANILISEFVPNPVGSDSAEWIELFNAGEEDADLRGWVLDDIDGGSRPYVFKETVIAGQEYFVIKRSESKIALNNNGDQVRLFSPGGTLIDSVDYGDTREKEAFARSGSKWFWTSEPTPEKANIIKTAGEDILTETEGEKPQKKENDEYYQIELNEINEFAPGDKIKTAGTVTVLPGILGAQYFYIQGEAGAQVYSYAKDFPTLAVGDYIEVAGELSAVNNEPRIKIKTLDDIEIISRGNKIEAKRVNCADFKDSLLGALTEVEGEVVERKGGNLFLDDGTGEIYVFIKETTGIVLEEVNTEDRITIAGVLSKTSAGYRLLPRESQDIRIKDKEIEPGEVLGGVETAYEWNLPARDKKMELFRYLLIISGFALLVLIVLLIKSFRKIPA